MTAAGFRRAAGLAALLAGASGLLYSISFIFVARVAPALGGALSGLFLLVGGLLGAAALIGLHEWVRDAGGGYATLALVLGLAGSLAAVMHGGYDLANALHPAGGTSALPSQVDPRGLGTFGLTGLSLLLFAGLMTREPGLGGLAYLGFASAALLLLVYLGRLIVLNPTSPLILGPAGIEGVIVNPTWYAWLGITLRAGPPQASLRA